LEPKANPPSEPSNGGSLIRPTRKIEFPEPIQQICPTGKTPKSLSIPLVKNILLFRNSNLSYMFAILSHQEGRYAIVTFAGRAAVDAKGA
jgi:hypothetical protein